MSTTKILAITTGTILTLGTAYAIYFDYKRRTDPQFRRQLRRGKRAAEKQREKEERDQESQQKQEIQAAYKEVKNDIYPSRPDEMEQFFLTEISQAEAVVAQGTLSNTRNFSSKLFTEVVGDRLLPLLSVVVGERLIVGPAMYVTAAKHFYRALKVYPNTPELLDIYKKTVPDALFNLIMGLREYEDNDSNAPHHESMD